MTLELIFVVPPTIPSDLVETRTAPFGSTVVMDCKTTLDPPVANTWYKQGGVLPAEATQTNGQLTIPDVKGEDAGTYICTSKSPVGTIDIPTTLIVTGNLFYNRCQFSDLFHINVQKLAFQKGICNFLLPFVLITVVKLN